MAALSYRPEIDGLRTVAVMPVILFHAGIETFSGGFVGVDVFFVISGYLITAILAREIEAGDFSILRFYERRARRILPALFLVMLVSLPFAWMWMFPAAFKDFGQSLAATGLFVSNVLFWRESGYFDTAAELKPFLHTWSLAVEEQYYILFPPALWAVWRLTGRRGVVIGLVLVALASLAMAEWASTRYRSAGFYLLPTRAWELLAGSLLALWLGRNAAPRGLLAQIGGLAGLALIVWAILFLDKSTPFPSLWTLAPVGGAALIILCAGPATWAGRVLSLRPMVGIGLISYSAYLWHQPLFAFARLRSLDTPPQALMLGLAAITLILAWLSWRFVERPFRNKGQIHRKTIFAAAVAGSVAALAAGVVAHRLDGIPGRYDATTLALIAVSEDPGRGRTGCVNDTALPLEGCVFNPDFPQRAVLWGDSHAMALAEGLAGALAPFGIGLEHISSSGCRPILNVIRDSRPDCARRNAETLAYLAGPNAPDTVIVVARWAIAFDVARFDNGAGGVEHGPPVVLYPETGDMGGQDQAAWITQQLHATVTALQEAGQQVVIPTNLPEAGWDVPRYLALQRIGGRTDQPALHIDRAVFDARNASSAAAFAPLAAWDNVTLIDPTPLFCDAARCDLERDRVALFRDDNHLSPAGAALLGHPVAAAVANIMAANGAPVSN